MPSTEQKFIKWDWQTDWTHLHLAKIISKSNEK
jgi:hypothetical protein